LAPDGTIDDLAFPVRPDSEAAAEFRDHLSVLIARRLKAQADERGENVGAE